MKRFISFILSLLALCIFIQPKSPTTDEIINAAKNNNPEPLIKAWEEMPRKWQDYLFVQPFTEFNQWYDLQDFRTSDADMDTNRFIGPNASALGIFAALGTPETLTTLLQKRFDLLKEQKNSEKLLFPISSYGGFMLNLDGVEYKGTYEKPTSLHGNPNYLLFENTFLGNPLEMAVLFNRPDIVKAIIDWLKKTLEKLNAKQLLPDYLNYPSANYVTEGRFIFGGTPLILALLLKRYPIAEILLENGAPFHGSSKGTKRAYIIDTKEALPEPKELSVEELLTTLPSAHSLSADTSKRVKIAQGKGQKSMFEAEKRHAEKIRLEQKTREEEERSARKTALALENIAQTDKIWHKERLENVLKKPLFNQADFHEAGKMIFYHPEFFELVIKNRPDLEAQIANTALEIARPREQAKTAEMLALFKKIRRSTQQPSSTPTLLNAL